MKNKIAKNTAQHGDVTLVRLNALPQGEIKHVSKKRLVVADGEHAGHQHVIEDDDAELIEIGGKLLLKLEKPSTIVHPEHKPITLDKGIWEVGRVQEFDWFSKMQRQVID